MSIEPASVSIPVVRENDNGSPRNVGSETQGSATGRKEGQFGSFWDKAVFGAQKLFGYEQSSQDGFEEESIDKDEESTRDESVSKGRSEQGLGGPVGLANRGFSALSQTVRREGMGGMTAFGATERSFEPTLREEPKREMLREETSIERRSNSLEPKGEERIEEEYDDDDEKRRNAAKTADLLLRPLPLTSSPDPGIRSDNLLKSNNQEVMEDPSPVGINSAKRSVNNPIMPSLVKTQTSQETALSELMPLAAPQAVSVEGSRGVLEGDVSQADRKPVAPNAHGKEVSAVAKESRGDGAVISQIARSANQSVLESSDSTSAKTPAESIKTSEGLGFDSDKAKHDLSKAMGKSRSLESVRLSKATPTDSVESPGQRKVASSLLESGKQELLDAKPIEQPVLKTFSAKAQGPQQRASEPTKAPANQHSAEDPKVEATASDTSAAKKIDTRPLHAELRPLEVRPQANRAGPTNPALAANPALQANAVSGAKAGMGAGAQSQGDSLGNSEKRDFNMSAARDAAPKASAIAPKGDASQGFQMSGSSSSSSSKTAFVAKAQPTRYASKSVNEVKEVYTALSKSVERLANTKSDTISIRINFDQGGSMALRVSMDGGKINATMQTDLPGLEGLIKSSWSELVADLSAKGLKLNAPQFANANGEARKDDSAMNFEQRESQSSDGASSDSKARGGRRGQSAASPVGRASQAEGATEANESATLGQRALKTYA